MTPLPAPRMDRRRVRTRAALLRAGQALFADRSVDGVSIDDIVAAADVAKGSFYNHFPDKEALAQALADEVRKGVEAFVAEVTDGVADPAERIARSLCGFARLALENPPGVRLQNRLFHGAAIPDLPMNRGVRADIRAGLDAGQFVGVSLEAGVLMAVGLVQIAVARVLNHDTPAEAAALSRDLAFGLLRGLGLDAASARATAAKAAAAIFAGHPSAA
ncbi:MAG: TetR family transcriptional regulator [Phenylobacterium sp.]|nr:TetR family transcriptional regulator [Phenylobacterium sp.]